MLKPAALFTDGAVLCRDREIRIFGRADTGKPVTARLEDSRGNVLAEECAEARENRFLINLPPQKAQTGCRLVLGSGAERITAENIAVGDVYLAGGQSNMELEVRNAKGGTEAIPDDPLLRFFNVPRKAYVCDEQQQAVNETRWQAVTRETAGYNSAVASVFGTEMRRKHPEIPVGIIGCYWGGTSVTCWMDGETLRSLTEGIRYLDTYAEACGDKSMAAYLEEENVKTVLNLADTEEKMLSYEMPPYSNTLWENGAVILCQLKADPTADDYNQKLIEALKELPSRPAPYVVHCMEGKDRTGYVCALLEGLCGATYDEIVDDYLITYDNYYQKTPEKDSNVCNALVSLRLNTCLMYYASVSDEALLKNINYAEAFSGYLTSHGMNRQQVDALVQALK